MKAELIVCRGVIAVVFAGLLAGGTYAQSRDPTPQQQDIQNDKKDIRNDKTDLAKDRADRNADQRDINHDKRDLSKDRANRNAHQRDINHDKRDLHKDRKDLRHDKRGTKSGSKLSAFSYQFRRKATTALGVPGWPLFASIFSERSQTRMVPSKTFTAAPLTRGTSFFPLCVTSTSIWLGRPISAP